MDGCASPLVHGKSGVVSLGSTYIKLIPIAHQRVVQQVAVHLLLKARRTSAQPARHCLHGSGATATHLRLDQDQIDEQNDVVMLDVFVAEAPAVLADREPDVVAARLIAAGVGVLCP